MSAVMNREDLITAMAKARWDSLVGDTTWSEMAAWVQYDQRQAMRAAGGAAVEFVADWLDKVGADTRNDVASAQWREDMGE